MSVLTCPVCQGGMKEVERQGVLIDTCTQCRGVWLDRGELEKLAGAFDSQNPASFAAAAPQGREPSRGRDARPERFDDDDYDDDHRGYQKRTKTSRFLDFFD
jgi:uncharacterized protein